MLRSLSPAESESPQPEAPVVPGRRWAETAAALGAISVFFLALALTCGGIHALLPLPDVPEVKSKLRWLDQHRAEYDTIFIGSSRVRRQVSPLLFDEQMQRNGFPTRSYNLGIDAMTFPELPYLFDRFLEQKPPRLRLVIVDLNAIRRKLDPASGAASLRSIYWHNVRYTAQVCEAILRGPRGDQSGWETVTLIASHLGLMARNYSNLGRGADLLSGGKNPMRFVKANPVGLHSTGYFPVAESLDAAEATILREKIAAIGDWNARSVLQDAVLERELQRLARKIEAAGAKAFFFSGPTVSPTRLPSPRLGEDSSPVTFAFDDIAAFPALYSPEHRYDLQHLNAAGAEIFTRLLADKISVTLGNGQPH